MGHHHWFYFDAQSTPILAIPIWVCMRCGEVDHYTYPDKLGCDADEDER